jgi:hypothetical protein
MHHYIFGRIFDPLRKGGLKRIAVGAAVPKELNHFNFAGLCVHWQCAVKLDEVFAWHKLGWTLCQSGHREAAESSRSAKGGEREVTTFHERLLNIRNFEIDPVNRMRVAESLNRLALNPNQSGI